MRRLLIVGASILQLPAIIKAKELGYFVGVIDINPNAIGIEFSDEFFNISTNDIEGVMKVAESFMPDGIMTLATDMPMRAIANATSKMGLSGISWDTAIKATDKGQMIEAFKVNNVECPWFFIIRERSDLDTIKKELKYPCIFKPTDNAGSRGVIHVLKEEEIEEAYSYSKSQSKEGVVLIEEFLKGPEVSVEVMVIERKVHILAITDKLTTGPPYFVEMGHSQPTTLSESDKIKIKDLATRAIEAVGIENGPSHVEIIFTENGPRMVELGARMGGDCITSHLVPLSTGIDMVKATIELATGILPDIEPKFELGSAIRYIKTEQGIIKDIIGSELISGMDGIKEIVFTKNIGNNVTSIKSSTDRVGYVVAQGLNAEDAITICEEAIRKISVITI